MRLFGPCFAVALAIAIAPEISAEGPPTRFGEVQKSWGVLLGRHVVEGGLDYRGLARDRVELDRVVAAIAELDPRPLSRERRLAFWINAYNVTVVRRLLDHYPDLRSVRDIDGFFDRKSSRVAGAQRTLDEIERQSRDLDARSHFALVCAALSCPDLRHEPYRPEAIELQLAEQTRRFLSDPAKGLRFDEAKKSLWLSSIFKWYASDFTGDDAVDSSRSPERVVGWILPRLDESLAQRIRDTKPQVRFFDYDWRLNDLRE